MDKNALDREKGTTRKMGIFITFEFILASLMFGTKKVWFIGISFSYLFLYDLFCSSQVPDLHLVESY